MLICVAETEVHMCLYLTITDSVFLKTFLAISKIKWRKIHLSGVSINKQSFLVQFKDL